MGKSIRQPLEATDFLDQLDGTPNLFGKSTTKETTGQGNFSPKDFPNVNNPTPYDSPYGLDAVNINNQSGLDMVGKTATRLSAGIAGGFAQSLIGLLDANSWGNDDYNSSLFGLSTKDINDWTNKIEQNNTVLEKNQGKSWQLTDPAWWSNMIASSGTGIGMGLSALVQTAAIEAGTGGLGTAGAIAELGNAAKKIWNLGKGVEGLTEGLQAAKGLKSAATIYAVMNRLGESRMEAQQSYQQVTQDLSQIKNPDGTSKFSQDEIHKLAKEGADRTWQGNLPLMLLDILAYRTMVFNPISGTGTGLLEKGLEKAAGMFGESNLGKAAGWGLTHGVGTFLEGAEEGEQNIAQDEGQHYARVLGGLDDGTTFSQRLGKDIQSDSFWNDFAGGVIGAPIIGGAMHVVESLGGNQRAKYIREVHQDFIKNISKLDNYFSDDIEKAKKEGDTAKVDRLIAANGQRLALKAKHLDAMTDSDAAFSSYLNFLQGTLGEANEDKGAAIADLGKDPTPEMIQSVKDRFNQHIEDAKSISDIYDKVKNQYKANFVPSVVQDQFRLNQLLKGQSQTEDELNKFKNNLPQYNQLTNQGKFIYDKEFELRSLNHELSRLNTKYNKETDQFEKENLNKVIGEVQNKLTDISKQVDNLNTDTTYNQEDKNRDRDILDSSIRTPEFQDLIHKKNQYDNEISLQRKNVALWNNKQYLDNQTELAVKNARTEQQLNTATQNDTKAQEQSKEKELQLKAQKAQEELDAKKKAQSQQQDEQTILQQADVDAANELVNPKTENNNTKYENDDLFSEKADTIGNLIDSKIKPATTTKQQVNPELSEDEIDRNTIAVFSPSVINPDKFNDEEKTNLKNAVAGMVGDLGGDINFEDLARHVARVKGKPFLDKTYQALEKGWELNNNETPDPDRAIYKKIFNNPLDTFTEVTDKILSDITEEDQASSVKTNDEIGDKLEESEKPADEFDADNQPIKIVYQEGKIVTSNTNPKLIKGLRQTIENEIVDEHGNLVITHDYTSDELKEGEFINPFKILDNDKYQAGTELDIRIPENADDVFIPVYNNDGSRQKEPITWGQWKAQNPQFTPNTQQYQDKIPIIAYDKGQTEDKGLAFVHDVDWYHERRFRAENANDIELAKSNTREIRKAVLANNGQHSITITENRPTTFDPFKTKVIGQMPDGRPKYEFIPYTQANPQATFALTKNSEELTFNKRDSVFNDDNNIILRQKPFISGFIYELRRTGMKDGKKAWTPLEVAPQPLSKEAQITVFQALKVYINKNNPGFNKLYTKTWQGILDATGIDIKNINGIESFIRLYINSLQINNKENRISNNDDAKREITNQSNKRVEGGGDPITGFITFLGGGNLAFGINNTQLFNYANPNTNRPDVLAISNNNLNRLLQPLIPNKEDTGKISILSSYKLHYNINAAQEGKPVIHIDNEGNVTKVADTYRDYILQNYKTNVRAVNIGTEEKPNYVSSDNMISYELTKPKTEEKIIEPIDVKPITVDEVTESKPEQPSQEDLDSIMKQALEQAAKLGINPNNLNFSPTVLTEEQRKQATKDLDRIGDLNDQEEGQLVNFFTNQIFSKLEDINKLDVKQIKDEVEKIFKDHIQPLINAYTDNVKFNEDLYSKFPQLNQLPDLIKEAKRLSNRIEDIGNNLDPLIKKAFIEVQRNTGVTLVKENNEYDDNNENSENTNETILGDDESVVPKESLTINPENSVTNTIRRFLKAIPALNKNGEQITGVFGLPVYEDSSSLIQILQTKLANTPASFDMIIQNIEKNLTEYNWQKPLLDKLKNTNQEVKYQFTKVMSMSPLRMKFTMITYNKKTGKFSTALWNTNEGGITDAILNDWKNKFNSSNLVMSNRIDAEGNTILNKTFAESLIKQFEAWTGRNLKTISSPITYTGVPINTIKKNKGIEIQPTGKLLTELKTNLTNKTDRMKFQVGTQWYQVENIGNEKFKVNYIEQVRATKNDVADWLSKFGITLSAKTLDELRNETNANNIGLYHNYTRYKWEQLFDTETGLVGILASKLKLLVEKQGEHSFDSYGSRPLDESIVKSLAKLETKYDTTHVPHGGRDNGKSFYAITLPKFITDRATELKSQDSTLRDQLKKISFTKNSLWLSLMDDNDFRDRFGVSHTGFNAMQILKQKTKSDMGITKLAELDYEIATKGIFWDMKQGKGSFKQADGSVTYNYPNTNIAMRWAGLFSPTMSDKSQAIPIETIVLDLKNKDLDNGKGINQEVKHVLYTQVVKPELERIIKFFTQIKETNIKSYDKGAQIFYFIPKMNTLEYSQGYNLKEAIKRNNLTLEDIESNKELMDKIYQTITDVINSEKKEKLVSWEKNDIIIRETGANTAKTGIDAGQITEIRYIDDKYLNSGEKFEGSLDQKADMAAYDLVVNEMIGLANSFMMFAGDPALKYKVEKTTDKNDYTQIVKDTFVNVGKRLANQIAPRTRVAESENESYIQIMLADRESIASKEFMKFSTLINDGHEISDKDYDFIVDYKSKEETTKEEDDRFNNLISKYPKSEGFFKIEASDAQEYTTWREHLDLLGRLGKLDNIILDITAQDIADARALFASGKKKFELTEREQKIIGKVMQPMKPVYTGQIFDEDQDVMREVYIKSSSFPLIPQLTEGFEIDKLRDVMEKIQSKRSMNVRASYQTANKVGAVKNPVNIWGTDGRISTDVDNGDGTIAETDFYTANDNDWIENEQLKKSYKTSANMLVLPRKNFGIQQEVPFKSGKKLEDKVSYSTQLMKIIGSIIQQFDNYTYQGKEGVTGQDLHREFNDLHINLINSKKQQLFDELGLDNSGRPLDKLKTAKKIQDLLKREATDRGYPLQTIKGLELRKDKNDKDTDEFVVPLWASINSNKFESLLNAIVTNRVAKIKFPGNSYVAGSPEGFIIQSENNITTNQQSKMVYTPAWNGKELQATYYKDVDGKVRVSKAQVFVSSKFRDNNGKLIDLFEGFKDGEGKYIVQKDGSYHIKQNMFDSELFRLTSFRIPATGIGSGSQIEIAGFLPAQQGDLMILPSVFTKIKGLDFDVDKENTYQYWHHQLENGKFERLGSKHKATILAEYDKNLKDAKEAGKFNGILNEIGEDADIEDYTDEEINEQDILKKKNAKLEDKLTQNKILEIYEAVYNNPDKKLQSKINSVLNTDYTEDQANLIDKAISSKNENWTPLSGEYNKQKLQLGANGAIGKGAYSMDVTFHALAQQALKEGKPLTLNYYDEVEDTIKPKIWKFGNIESTGILGEGITRDGSRDISNVLDEIAQTGVDNEKLQIMGRVNMNNFTLDVQKMFNLLGLDKGEDGNSISFMFMSQPILRDYVGMLANSRSNVGKILSFESAKDAKERIKNELIQKYYPNLSNEDKNKFDEEVSTLMSTKNMFDAIKDKGKNGKLQAGVLLRFLEMEEYGLAIRNIQTTLNVESKGLGKSFYDVIQKRDKLNKIGVPNPLVGNVSSLVGEYLDTPNSSDEYNDLLNQGYYDTGSFMVKPSTLVGAYNITATNTAYTMWSKYLPYDSITMEALYKEILPLMEIDATEGGARATELKQDVFSEFKKYLATFGMAGMKAVDETANDARKDLYMDSEENTSLAKYIQGLMDTRNNHVIDTFIKTNKFLNKLSFEVKKDGTPSLIKFNNTKGESFDENYIYNSFISLLEVRGKDSSIQLPQIGNKQYSLDSLAQALASYAYLGNAKQEAIQFTKYIPVSYLNQIGYSFLMRAFHGKLYTEIGKNDLNIKDRTPETNHLVSPFTTQYIQHNPELIKGRAKFTDKQFKNQFIEDSENTIVSNKDISYPFITVYDATVKSKSKFRLYKLIGNNRYTEIPLLGVFGMDEYQHSNDIGQSIVNGVVKSDIQTGFISDRSEEEIKTDPYNITSGDIKTVLQSIIDEKNPTSSLIASQILPYISPTLKIQTGTQVGNFSGFDAVYDHISNTITIRPDLLDKVGQNEYRRAILEEVMHSLTVNQIKPYITQKQDGLVEVKSNAPKYVTDIVRLYNDVRSKSDSAELDRIWNKIVVENKGITKEELAKYPLVNIYEFMARAWVDKNFQNYLSKEEFKQTGKTRLEKFKDFVVDVLKSIGINFEANTAIAELLNSTFELIQNENKSLDDINNELSQDMWDDVVNGDEPPPFRPSSEFPDKQLNIQDEKCI